MLTNPPGSLMNHRKKGRLLRTTPFHEPIKETASHALRMLTGALLLSALGACGDDSTTSAADVVDDAGTESAAADAAEDAIPADAADGRGEDVSAADAADADSPDAVDASLDADPWDGGGDADVAEGLRVAGIVQGLEGVGLDLTPNGDETLSVDVDGDFTFDTLLEDGATSEVALANQPTSPPQSCSATRGSGVIDGADVDTVGVLSRRRCIVARPCPERRDRLPRRDRDLLRNNDRDAQPIRLSVGGRYPPSARAGRDVL